MPRGKQGVPSAAPGSRGWFLDQGRFPAQNACSRPERQNTMSTQPERSAPVQALENPMLSMVPLNISRRKLMRIVLLVCARPECVFPPRTPKHYVHAARPPGTCPGRGKSNAVDSAFEYIPQKIDDNYVISVCPPRMCVPAQNAKTL